MCSSPTSWATCSRTTGRSAPSRSTARSASAREWCDDVTTTGTEETCADAVSRALKVSLEYLAVTYGHDMEDWRWGEAHAVRMKSRILGEVPAIGSWFEVNMPTGGEKETVKAGGFDVADPERPFAQNHGAGYRAVYDLGGAGETRSSSISTGQSGNPLSSYYEDYAEAWGEGRIRPHAHRPDAAVEDDALGTLVLRPR